MRFEDDLPWDLPIGISFQLVVTTLFANMFRVEERQPFNGLIDITR